jgi:ABC-type dipeptide/oligopeptide/nickel transport system ATPase component
MALLDIQNLCVDFKTSSGWFRAVDGVDLTVEQGRIHAIVGESGSGKSVAMLAVMGLLPKTARSRRTGSRLTAMTSSPSRMRRGARSSART